MPTNRVRRSRYRQTAPTWATTLRETGHWPKEGDIDRAAFIGWLFFGEAVEGLPEAESSEGRELLTAFWSSSAK